MLEQYEHPDITRALRTGYPKQDMRPVCKRCGARCEWLFKDIYGQVFACDVCVEQVSADQEGI